MPAIDFVIDNAQIDQWINYGIGLQVSCWIFEQLNAGEFLSRIYDKNMAIGCAEVVLLSIADFQKQNR